MKGSGRAREAVELAFSELAGVSVALEARRALEVGVASPDALDPKTRWLDAARLLLGDVTTAAEQRRWVLCGQPGSTLAVLLGPALTIRTVALDCLHPLPELLVPAAARIGCAALVSESGRFSFLLDPRLLAELAERPQPARCA